MIRLDIIDWRLAPAEADAWEMTEFGFAVWTKIETMDVTSIDDPSPKAGLGTAVVGRKKAPTFGYKGAWQDSYTPRPK